MNIGMVVKNTFTHDARVTREATALIADGHLVTIFCLPGKGLKPIETLESGLKVVRIPIGGFSRLYQQHAPTSSSNMKILSAFANSFLALRNRLLQIAAHSLFADLAHRFIDFKIISEIEKYKEVQVIHCHDLDALFIGSRLKDTKRVKLIYDSHEMATDRNLATRGMRRRAFRRERKLIGSVDAVITAAPGYSQRIRELYNIEVPLTILNVPDSESQSPGRFSIRESLKIPDSKFLAVYQGSIQKNRGIEQAIDAISQVDNAVLVIIGYGEHRAYLESSVAIRGLGEKIRFFGPVANNQIVPWISEADAVLCLINGGSDSYRYSLPNKLFEAISAEVPVIASNYPGIGAFVLRERIGLVAEPSELNEVVEAIRALSLSRDLDQEFRLNCKKLKNSLDWKFEREKLLALYRRSEIIF
jgi:glycosyltransferase involved in cell wall biosynthesis